MSATTSNIAESEPLVLHFELLLRRMTAHDFFEFCRINRDLNLELTSEGDLIVRPSAGGIKGIRNATLNMRIGIWAEMNGTGCVFDSSTGFNLPNGAMRSPDSAWVRNERWDALTEDERERFPPLCPDFVVELRSRTDTLKNLRQKMEEYIANGAQLGWLIDPLERKVYVYRPSATVEEFDNPRTISGEPLLGGLELDLQEIWD